MSKHPFLSNEFSALRSIVWIGIVAVTVFFWALVAAAVVVLFR